MQLIVQRFKFTENSTGGELLIDGPHFCWTLEPRKDQSQGKPFCIPAGTYQVLLQDSVRFGMLTPHLQDVPGFSEIEIHPGNSPGDTEGCLLVGFDPSTDFVGQSRVCFASLMAKLKFSDEITITIQG